MAQELDIKKITRYPPECFIQAKPFDLSAGANTLARYDAIPGEYIIVFNGLGFTRTSGLRFWINADGSSEIYLLNDLAAAKGLDRSEDVKIPAYRHAVLNMYAGSAVSGYAWWHRVLVKRSTPLMKYLVGAPLSDRERELLDRYEIIRALKMQNPMPYDLTTGIETLKEVMVSLSESGDVLRVVAPDGYKIVLKEIAVDRPGAVNQATLSISRDNIDVAELDLACLPNLEYSVPVRIVALEKLEITLDISAGAPHEVRVSYGLGRVTIPEKIRWGLELSSEERAIADAEDLYGKVEVGIL